MTKRQPELAFLVPVLGRPHRVEPLRDAVVDATPEATLLFIADPDDEAEVDALFAAGAGFIAPGGNYAQKIRAGVEATTEPLLFLGADDLFPRRPWFDLAKRHLSDNVQVVGVNDLCSKRVQDGMHATHFLMTRTYAERPTIDGGPGPFHEGYAHWYCDDEMVATARKRGVLAFAPEAIVEHLHPQAGKASDDETYRKGRENWRQDRKIFRGRSPLWT